MSKKGSSPGESIMRKIIALSALAIALCLSSPAAAETDFFASIDGSPFRGVTGTSDSYEAIVKLYFKGDARLSYQLDEYSNFLVETSPDGQAPFRMLGPGAISGIWIDENGDTQTAATMSMIEVMTVQQVESHEDGKTWYYPSSVTIKLILKKTEFDKDFIFRVQFKNKDYQLEDRSEPVTFCSHPDTAEAVDFCNPFKGQPRVAAQDDGTVEVRIGTDSDISKDGFALYKELNDGEDLIASGLDSDTQEQCTVNDTSPDVINVCSASGTDAQHAYDIVAIIDEGEIGTFFLTYGSVESERFTIDEESTEDNTPCDDFDLDGACDDVDTCIDVINPEQTDTDGDGDGDACDDDDDGDGVFDISDNCPLVENADQIDDDEDSIGDACDPEVAIEDESTVADIVMPEPQAPQAAQDPADEAEEADDVDAENADDTLSASEQASWYDDGDCSLTPYAGSGAAGPIALIVFATLIPMAIIRKRK